jgi:TetR/AcrR family transcriptional repressor of bet genes
VVTRTADARADLRRAQLAESALQTLSELGYARTSVRDIAQKSDFSHGVLHYYFKDKAELVAEAVRLYKTTCAQRYDEVIATATTADELLDGFCTKLVESLVVDAAFHRLWYDLRVQGMYLDTYQDSVLQIDALLEDMVWRVVSRFAELSGREVGLPSVVVYGCLDGVFQKALLDHMAGREGVADGLAATARGALPLFLAPA